MSPPIPDPPDELETPAAGRILELLPDPVLVVRRGTGGAEEIAYANRAARELFRLRLVGAPVAAAVRHPAVLDALAEAFERRAPAEVAFETAGVQPRFWRASVLPVDQAGEAHELVLVLRDETDLRRTERMRADFLANASHELRTPLASLTGFVETLRTHARDDPQAQDRFLGIMAEQAGRMARLIDDLLSLSRIELSEHIPPSGRVDLARMIDDVLDAGRPLAAERGVSVAVEVHGRVTVTGDRDDLVQVAQNLIDNAVKYAPAGGIVRVAVTSAPSLEAARPAPAEGLARHALLTPEAVDGQAWGVLSVTDEGPGIAREHLPRLSERFYRVEGQRTPGTGLGLAIVKHIVNRHRGGLIVDSAPGAGATFAVQLPEAPA